VEWEVFQAENASYEAIEDRPTVDPQFAVKEHLTGGGRVDSKRPNVDTFRGRKLIGLIDKDSLVSICPRGVVPFCSELYMDGNNALRAVKRATKGGVFVTHSMCKFGIQLPQHLPGRKF
jgi:hypothetical protein